MLTDTGFVVTLANEPSSLRAYAGDLDDVRIYSRVLAPSEIAALAAQ